MKFPPYVQRGLIALVVLLLLVTVARLLVSLHQQDERISILEAQVGALMADTTRLQIPSSDYVPLYTTSHTRRSSYRGEKTQAHLEANGFVSQSSNNAVSVKSSFSSSEDRPNKFTEPHLFDLNTVDSLTLIRIPGIASRTASVILKQRQRYGGFYDANQLRDFLTWDAAQDYLDEWCTRWFTANADRIVRLPINSATISQLQRHPYISHEQAVEISQYRVRNKGFRQVSELQQLSTFAPEEITHLQHYLSFE